MAKNSIANPCYSLGHIPLAQLARTGKAAGLVSDASLAHFHAALAAWQKGTPSCTAQRFQEAVKQHRDGHMSFQILCTYVQILMQYAEAIDANALQCGTFVQNGWTPAQHGWHHALSLLLTAAHTQPHPIVSASTYMLAEVMNTPQKLMEHLVKMFSFHRQSELKEPSEPYLEVTLLQDSQIRVAYESLGSSRKLELTLTPCQPCHPPSPANYKVTVTWNSGSPDPTQGFAIEELLARSQPFGQTKLHLPLLAPARKTA